METQIEKDIEAEITKTEYLVEYCNSKLFYQKYHDKDVFTEEVNMRVFAEQCLKNQLIIMRCLLNQGRKEDER